MSSRNFDGQAFILIDEPDSSSQGKGNLTKQREHEQLEQRAPPQINHVPWPSPWLSQPWPSMTPMINYPQYPTFVNNFPSPIPIFSPYSQASKQHSIISSRQPNIPGEPPTEAVPNLPLPKNKPLLPQKATFDKLGFVHFYGKRSGSKMFDLIGTKVIRNEASRSPTAPLTDGDKLQMRDDLFELNRNQFVIIQKLLPLAKGPNANKKPRIVCYMKCANQPKCKKQYVVKRHNNHFGYYESRCSHDHKETTNKELPLEIQKMAQKRYREADAPRRIVSELIMMQELNPTEFQYVIGNRMDDFNTNAGREKIAAQIKNKIDWLKKKAKKASVESDDSDDANANANTNANINMNTNADAINIAGGRDKGQRAPTKRNYSTANATTAQNNQEGQVSASNHGSSVAQGRQTMQMMMPQQQEQMMMTPNIAQQQHYMVANQQMMLQQQQMMIRHQQMMFRQQYHHHHMMMLQQQQVGEGSSQTVNNCRQQMMRSSTQRDDMCVNHQGITCDSQDETLLRYNDGNVENPIVRVSHKEATSSNSFVDRPSNIKGE